jgi:hypothetical protein
LQAAGWQVETTPWPAADPDALALFCPLGRHAPDEQAAAQV